MNFVKSKLGGGLLPELMKIVTFFAAGVFFAHVVLA